MLAPVPRSIQSCQILLKFRLFSAASSQYCYKFAVIFFCTATQPHQLTTLKLRNSLSEFTLNMQRRNQYKKCSFRGPAEKRARNHCSQCTEAIKLKLTLILI